VPNKFESSKTRCGDRAALYFYYLLALFAALLFFCVCVPSAPDFLPARAAERPNLQKKFVAETLLVIRRGVRAASFSFEASCAKR
jgi:hypothetical protein